MVYRDVFVVVPAPDMDVSISMDCDDFVRSFCGRGELGFLGMFVVGLND